MTTDITDITDIGEESPLGASDDLSSELEGAVGFSGPITATGRRKTAVATVRMTQGTGRIEVNGSPMEEYFPTIPLQNTVLEPLQISGCRQDYDIMIRATGGGAAGQAGAARMAIARALVKESAGRRPALKSEGCLRRDPRMKERKKSGQPGARKRFQFSKR